MNFELLINVLVTVALVAMMIAIGLDVNLGELIKVITNWRTVASALFANYVCVPAITIGLLLFFDPDPMVVVGFLILAACPAAPFGPPFVAVAHGNVPLAAGLMCILAGSSAIVAPLLLQWTVPLLAGNTSVTVDTSRLISVLLITQILPLSVGMLLRMKFSGTADKLRPPVTQLSRLLSVLAIGVILVVQFPLLVRIRVYGFIGMFILLGGSLLVGWLVSHKEAKTAKSMAIVTALRNIGVCLMIASSAFANTAAVTAIAAYGLISLFGTLLVALVLGRIAVMSESNS